MILIADCIEAAAEYFGVSREALRGKSLHRAISQPRQFAMLAARQLTTASTTRIGYTFGGRDHTTIIYGAKNATKLATQQPALADAPSRIAELATEIAKRRGAIPVVELEAPPRTKKAAQKKKPPVILWTPEADAKLLRLWRSSAPWNEIGNRLGVCVCVCRYRLRVLRKAGAGPFPDDVPAFVPLIRHQYL